MLNNIKKIRLTRASVAMGDDVYAPHLQIVEINPNWTIVEILNDIVGFNYDLKGINK